MNTEEQKKALRSEALAARAKLKLSAPDAGQRIAKNFLSSVPLQSDAIVAGYIAARGELDPSPLITALRQRGVAIALPRVTARAVPLAFHLWEKNASPIKGAYELFEAAPGWPLARPAIVLVPLLAYDAQGYRLGYGGGYYDRSLRALRETGSVLAVGIAYDGQKITHVPRDAMDEQLDWIVTERNTQPCGKIDRK